jgi:hypothetical protein
VRARRRARRHARAEQVPPSAGREQDRKKDEVAVPLSEEPAARRRASAISPPPATSAPPAAPHPSANRDDQQGPSTKPQAPEAPAAAWSDAEVIGALRRCLELVAPTSASIEVLDPLRNGECGTPAPVRLKRIGGLGGVDISPPAVVNCSIVTRLHDWIEGTLQPAAERLLASRITRIVTASSYDCRNRIGTPTVRISEHAFANAIDIAGVVTSDGRRIDVLTDWGATQRDKRAQEAAREAAERQDANGTKKREPPSPRSRTARREASSGGRQGAEARSMADALSLEPASREAAFLRALHKGACSVFGTVLGPEANDAHRNHLHFDLAPRRRGALCE